MPPLPPANSWQEFAIIIFGGILLFMVCNAIGLTHGRDNGVGEYAKKLGAQYPKAAISSIIIILVALIIGVYFILINNIDECQERGGRLSWFGSSTRCIFPDGSWVSSTALESDEF